MMRDAASARPKKARDVITRLTRHAPALRALRWCVENDGGQNKSEATQWTITAQTSPPGVRSRKCSVKSSMCSSNPTRGWRKRQAAQLPAVRTPFLRR
jgi:hypothetical protein